MYKALFTNLLLALIAMTTVHLVSSHRKIYHKRPKYGTHSNPCHGVYENTTVVTSQGKILCIVPGEEELMEQLKTIGGYNKHYVARTEEEAQNFENILPWDGAATTQTLHQNGNHPVFRWRRYRSKRKSHPKAFPLKEDEDNLVDEKQHLSLNGAHFQLSKRSHPPGIADSKTVQCIPKGQKVGRKKLTQMCDVCQRTSELVIGRFPHFINEVTCETQNGKPTNGINYCKYRTFSFGKCVQGTMSVDLLKRTDKYTPVNVPSGDYFIAYKQVWIPYTQEIRSCCMCRY